MVEARFQGQKTEHVSESFYAGSNDSPVLLQTHLRYALQTTSTD